MNITNIFLSFKLLTSFFVKNLGRLLELYLKSVINPNMLSKAQHAYCKGKSTETALHSLVSQIERSLSTTESAICAFLAFNNVTPTAITSALELINALLTGRIVSSTLGDSNTSQ